jgi:uncharacterized membrane protein
MEHRVTTTVSAPPEDVWRLFTDLERWPELTGSIREVRRLDSGPLRVGSEAVVRQPGLPRARWRVTDLEPGQSFTWTTSAAGVTTAADHVVRADGNGSVIIITLRQHGPLAPLIGALTGHRTRRYVSMELEGFRRAAAAAHS